MNWDHVDSWWAASMLLNLAWFIYAMFQARWTRFRIREMQATLFNAAPSIHAAELVKHFKRIRNEEGSMLMQSAVVLLQEKKPRKGKSNVTN